MTRAYSRDLRERAVDFVERGGSLRAAAAHFSIGVSTIGAWARLKRATGDVVPGKQGKRPGSKLDKYEGYILGLIEENKDITLVEMTERLAIDCEVQVVPATLWYFLDKRGITYKKRLHMRANRSVLTSV